MIASRLDVLLGGPSQPLYERLGLGCLYPSRLQVDSNSNSNNCWVFSCLVRQASGLRVLLEPQVPYALRVPPPLSVPGIQISGTRVSVTTSVAPEALVEWEIRLEAQVCFVLAVASCIEWTRKFFG